MIRHGLDDIQDIVCVGAGPSVLVALHEAQQAGLKAIAIDKGPVCGALVNHPTYMSWFSTTANLELCGFPLLVNEKNPSRREYLKYCRTFTRYFGLKIVTYHEVIRVVKEDDGLFSVEARDMAGRSYTWRSRNVITGTGFFDSPRPLDIPGEELRKVTHRFSEAHFYADHDVVIVGAGSSAVEVSLELWREGARVTIVMRQDTFHTKYWLEPDIENRIKNGEIECYRGAEVIEIRADDVVIRDAQGATQTIPNDFVLAMTGYEPDTSLLESMGAFVDSDTKKPTLTEHYESTVPGLYVIGTLCSGVESNVIFIENSREHGPVIVQHIVAKSKERSNAIPVQTPEGVPK